MSPPYTSSTLHQLVAGWENECVEFKEANDNFSTSDIGIVSHRTPARYRNRFLAEAMVNLRMIDTMGFGIRQVMFRGQAKRFLPLPEYDLSRPGHVTLHLTGQFLDENYSRTLQAHPDLEWTDILALDRIQKGHFPDDAVLRSLRKRGLIEGRKPHLRITPDFASQPEARADYLRHRAFDDGYYCKLVLDYLAEFGSGKRADFDRLLTDKLSDALTLKQKERKIGNLLQILRRQGKIEAHGIKKAAVWKLTPAHSPEPPDSGKLSQT